MFRESNSSFASSVDATFWDVKSHSFPMRSFGCMFVDLNHPNLHVVERLPVRDTVIVLTMSELCSSHCCRRILVRTPPAQTSDM